MTNEELEEARNLCVQLQRFVGAKTRKIKFPSYEKAGMNVEGLEVTAVADGMKAKSLGVEPGWVILEVNGISVTAESFINQVRFAKQTSLYFTVTFDIANLRTKEKNSFGGSVCASCGISRAKIKQLKQNIQLKMCTRCLMT
eukprot:UN34415